MFTDGSKNEEGGVGAAVYDESTDECTYVKVLGRLTVLRAELSAILVALQRADISSRLELFTDSQVSLSLIRRWVYCPHELEEENHLDLLNAIGEASHRRRAITGLRKVQAHAGHEGNERVDTGAKDVANGKVPDAELVPAVGTGERENPWKCTPVTVDGEEICDTKAQTREVVSKWLLDRNGYKTKASGQWEGDDAEGLDREASNAGLWGRGEDEPVRKIWQTLRARFLDLITPAAMRDREMEAKGSTELTGRCAVCGGENANWFHILQNCTQEEMSKLYVARHNDIGLKVHSAIREGTMGRWLILHDFGKEDGEPAAGTVPEWMLPRGDMLSIPEVKYKVRKTDGSGEWEGRSGYKPDMIIVQGWPESAGPPPHPLKAYVGVRGVAWGGGGEWR